MNHIKLVASDMDGTFMRDDKTFDHTRFGRILDRMKQAGAHFVIASGNQYAQLSLTMEEFADRVSYVSDNGAVVVHKGQQIYSAHVEARDLKVIYPIILNDPNLFTIVSGLKAAYIKKGSVTGPWKSLEPVLHHHFPCLEEVEDMMSIDDEITKASVVMDERKTMHYGQALAAKLPDSVRAVISGYGSVDIIPNGINKAFGLDILAKRLGVAKDECIAFGDASNDLALLSYCGCGYAMANAMDCVLEIADKQAPSNNDDGVLEVLDQLF